MPCLLVRASLYVGLDTAVSHLAATTGVPMVVLFGPTIAERWSPWNNEGPVEQQCPLHHGDPGPGSSRRRAGADGGPARCGGQGRGMSSGPGSRRWLVLSYFSRIDGMACAQHIDDRIPLLGEAGIEPVLLTGPCGERWEEGRHAIARCVAPSGIRFEVRHLFRKRGLRGPLYKILEFLLLLPLLPFHLLEKILVDLDSQWSWFPLAARRGYALCREVGPGLIYSTGGAASAHLAAGGVARPAGR